MAIGRRYLVVWTRNLEAVDREFKDNMGRRNQESEVMSFGVVHMYLRTFQH